MRLMTLIIYLMFSGILFSQNSGEKISFIEDGINLYGKFFFESSLGSDKFYISDQKHTEIVPAGAVLSVVKPNYTIGNFSGKIEVRNADKTVVIKKIFFELNKSGKVIFYHPSEDDAFLGKRIEGDVLFK